MSWTNVLSGMKEPKVWLLFCFAVLVASVCSTAIILKAIETPTEFFQFLLDLCKAGLYCNPILRVDPVTP